MNQVWQVQVPPYPFVTNRGVGFIINPDYEADAVFVMHDHVYIQPNVPDPNRAVVTYGFDSPTTVKGLEVIQHVNGITAVEGFVGDNLDTLTSIGTAWCDRGDLTGWGVFVDGESSMFTFAQARSGHFFRFVVRKTPADSGYAVFRVFPLDTTGTRLPPAQYPIPTTDTAPSIPSQPVGQTNFVGENVYLSIVAYGSVPLAYQWRKDGTALDGMTNATLILANVTLADTGEYTVVVTNAFGSVTSAVARVEVTLRPFPYVADFEGAVGPEWSRRRIDVTPVGNRRFLGQFGNDTVRLSLTNLPPHTSVSLSFDLYVIRSWDGSYSGGGDVWDVRVGNGVTLLRTTFSNYPEAVHRQSQAYPGGYPGASFTPQTGAQEVNSLGYFFGDPRDAVYRLILTFPHTDQSLALDFTGSGLQDTGDESWGLDNVTLALDSSDAIFLPVASIPFKESLTQVQVNVGRVSLTPLATTATAEYTTVDGTAKAGQDYLAVSGTLTFGPGETNKTISIPIVDDALVESEEQFSLVLSNPSGGVFLGTSNVVIRIEDNDFPAKWTNTFENLSDWILYGDPLPQWISSIKGRSGVFDNNGDSWYPSGAISKQRFDLSTGYVIESQVYLDFSDFEGCWVGADIGIADPQYQDWGGYGLRLGFGLGAAGDACWAGPTEMLRHALLGGYYETDGGSESFGDGVNPAARIILADHLTNRWVTLTLMVSPDGFPAFFADGNLIYEGKKPVSTPLRSGTGQLFLGSRSSGSAGKAYHDSISFYRLEPWPGVSLTLEESWVDPATNAVHQVALGQGRVYLATDPPMVRVLDWDTNGAPTLQSSWEPFLTVSDLAVAGSTLFVSGWELNFLSTIDRVDVTDPTRPLSRGFCDTPGYVNALALDGNLLFVAEDEEGMEILDLSREPFPAVVGHYPTTSPAVAVRAVNRKAYLVTSQSLLILDVSNPAQPVRVGALYLGGEVTGLEIVGGTAYVLNRQSGLHLINVSDPTRPTERSVYRRATAARALAVSGPYVFLAAGVQGLQVLEVPEAGGPNWLVSYGTSSPAEDVSVSGNRVYVAAGTQGLLVLELVDSRLNLERSANAPNTIRLSWQPQANWALQRASNLSAPDWQSVSGSQNTNSVTLPIEAASEFFRLVRP